MGHSNLIIFLTKRCAGSCATCNVNAAPVSSGRLEKEDLDRLFAHSAISGIRHLIWTGGEPFENFNALSHGIVRAGELGLRSEILTAGYWFKTSPERLKTLAGSVEFSLRISIDREHAAVTGIETILGIAGECRALNIPLNFTVRNIPGDKVWEGLLIQMERRFPEYAAERKKDPRWVHRIPHVPVGRDDPYPGDGDPPAALSPCGMVFRDLVAGWDGNFYPCCGLFSLPEFEKYALGGIRRPGSAGGKVEELFMGIKERGPGAIREVAGILGGHREEIPYQNNCHACIDLLRRYEQPVGRYLAGETSG